MLRNSGQDISYVDLELMTDDRSQVICNSASVVLTKGPWLPMEKLENVAKTAIAGQAFHHATPSIWNTLPAHQTQSVIDTGII